MYNQIFKRKSVRKYHDKELSGDIIQKIEESIVNLKLYNNKACTLIIEIMTYDDFIRDKKLNFITKKMVIKAPYYLSIKRNHTEDAYINAGYCGEELVLKLKELGLDTCWVGAANVFDRGAEFIIGIAFGYGDTTSSVVRKRDPLEAYYQGDCNNIKIVEALREAPSAKNSQPARVLFKNNEITLYNNNKGDRILKDLNVIDMGIALRHLTLALDYLSIEYTIVKNKDEFIIKTKAGKHE